ncbi:U3 snoRNP protein [Malassezia vespertilionis]|nr:U3 snoRNP protein [Malassezia vespertilionis]WFD04982.1 U3 snoRNP protein [Malassezia vespertilionis]
MEADAYSEDDNEGGFEDLEEDEAGMDDAAEAPKRAQSRDGAFSIPSNEEIHGLKETSELYMNSMFKLQLDEMMRHVRVAKERAGPMELVLRRLHTLFMQLPAIPAQDLKSAKRALARRAKTPVTVPFPDPAPLEDAAYKYAFSKPSQMDLVGSWPLGTLARRPGDMDVDVEVRMPSDLFQEKDTFNARYFYKRAYYLAVLAAAIIEAPDLGVDVAFGDVNGDRRNTFLVLCPRRTSKDTDFTKLKSVIRIHLAHSLGTFPVARLAPSRNSLRGTLVDEQAPAPTPEYNASILQDALRLPHLVFLHHTATQCAAFTEACQLLKTWATQRGFGALTLSGTMYAGWRTVARTENARFLLTMLLAHLLHGDDRKGRRDVRKLSSGFSSYQLLRGVLEFLALHPWSTEPVFMRAQPAMGLGPHDLPYGAFAECPRVFVDPSGCLNLLSAWPAASLDLLQQEAAQTLRMLNDAETDHFSALFLTPCTAPIARFDTAAALTLAAHSKTSVARLDAGCARNIGLVRLLDVGATALGVRARGIAACYTAGLARWQVDAEAAQPSRRVELGIQLDAEHAFRQVDHGPMPEQKEDAERFRAFWGDIAELRRFRDGRVMESVVWPIASLADRTRLPERILAYALLRHQCISSASNLKCIGAALDKLLVPPSTLSTRAYLKDPVQLGFQPVLGALETLIKRLRAMDQLPLSVIGVAPADAALRSMSVFAPGALRLAELGHSVPDVASFLPVHTLLLTFETSGQWPDDLAAIQEMKTALYERMAHVLPAHLDGASMRVVYDVDARASETIRDQTYLEIVLLSGFAFAARIRHDREHVLLQRLAREAAAGAPRREAQKALARYETRFVHAPAHHAAMQALQDQHPALAPTARLVKRWFGAQMLSTQVAPEALELLAVAVFISSEHAPPGTSAAGFVRVLRLLRDWNWHEMPLLLPLEAATRRAHEHRAAKLDEERAVLRRTAAHETVYAPPIVFPAAARVEAEQNFRAARTRDPALHRRAWFIATELDPSASAWTHNQPNATVADGVRQLATRAVSILEGAVRSKDVQVLFTPSVQHYDFVIHIHAGVHTRYVEHLQPEPGVWLVGGEKEYKNLAALRRSVYGSDVRADFDPVRAYVQLLLALYPGTFTLFYDEHGGTAIGGLWNAKKKARHPFKVLLGHSSRPVAGSDVVVNRPAILAEVQRLGHGLVERIVVAKEALDGDT